MKLTRLAYELVSGEKNGRSWNMITIEAVDNEGRTYKGNVFADRKANLQEVNV